MKKKYEIQGMTCSACSAAVEKSVKKLDGINNVSVSLLTNSMTVDYDESNIDDQRIFNAVSAAGYQAVSNTNDEKQKEDDVLKQMRIRLWVSFIFVVPLMYLAMGHMFDWPLPAIFHGTANLITFAFTQFLLMLPIVIVNYQYFTVGFKTLWKRSPNMDTLVALGSSAAVLYGIFAIYMISYGLGHGQMKLAMQYGMDLYFESAGTILTLITLGKYLESKAKSRTSEAIKKLIELRPNTAIIKREGVEVEVMIDDVMVNDLVVVRPGAIIPVDGIVVEGQTTIDESALTGESMPVFKEKDAKVIGATVNQNGYIIFRVTQIKEDTTLSQIIRLVEEAASSKAPIARLADKISGVFVPIVIVISILTIIVWTLLGYDMAFVISMGISVLIISCPCALGLATPVAIMVATGMAAKEGILIKSSEALEKAQAVDTIVLDKTGTITFGKPQVSQIITYDFDENTLLQLVASVEHKSEHPLANAILNEAKKKELTLLETEALDVIVGKGISAVVNKQTIVIGNLRLLTDKGIDVTLADKDVEELSEQGITPLYCAIDNKLVGVIGVADQIKTSSKEAIRMLKKDHNVIMLTGDNKKTATAIGKILELDQVFSEVLPDQKEQVIIDLQSQGKVVAMVGDGINDAVALTRADVGIAIGAGSDIAIESADIVLMKNDLSNVFDVIKISKKTLINIKQNLFWAFIYNIIGIPIAAGVLYLWLDIRLNPMIAAAAMSFSSVSVVTNALRLRYINRKKEK